METLDELLRGRVRLYQPRKGARVTLDPLLLADFCRPGARVLDLGCGVGVIALAMAAARPDATFVGVELQPALAALARKNAALNGVAERFTVVEGDLSAPRALPLAPESFDVVVANPPYKPERAGRAAPRADRALSRQELACTVEQVARAARRFLRPRGRFAAIFPAQRAAELLAAAAGAGLRPRALRPVHSVAGEPARRVLFEAARDYKGGLTLLAPLVVHEADRRTYTAEASRILGAGPDDSRL